MCGSHLRVSLLSPSITHTSMIVLRPTRKLQGLLPLTGVQPSVSTTALGDWYVNRLIVDRRPLLILVSATSLLPVLIAARDVRSLSSRLPALIASTLHRIGVPPDVVAAEVQEMSPVVVAPTIDRSVVGIMVDFAHTIPYHLDQGTWDDTTLPFVAARLAETPCHASRSHTVVFPYRKAPEVLAARWSSPPATVSD